MQGLVPAIIQEHGTGRVLMLGFMNEEALRLTRETGLVTFWSRTRKKLWTKGEESGNKLHVKEIHEDCDGDTLLIRVRPDGPVCHTGSWSCFDTETDREEGADFLLYLQDLLADRKKKMPEDSYTAALFRQGLNRIAQKVGEEAVELVIEAKDDDRDRFLGEAADLVYHLLVLLLEKGLTLQDVVRVLKERH